MSPLDGHAFHAELRATHDAALSRTKEALRAEGFGVVTEVDLQATFREKLGVEFPRYTILGACDPRLANRALTADPEMGLFLPCNVLVYERPGADSCAVSLVDPVTMLGAISDPELQAVAGAARAGLSRVAAALREETAGMASHVGES
jgi:uncharacterized protein (DUF302 family)